jgi:hypothetical protein
MAKSGDLKFGYVACMCLVWWWPQAKILQVQKWRGGSINMASASCRHTSSAGPICPGLAPGLSLNISPDHGK